MGNKSTKSSLRNAIVYLNISADPISANDDKFWGQIFGEEAPLADEVIKNITVQEIRILRDGSPKNFATLAYKMVERLCLATGTLCNTHSQQTAVLNAIKILIRMLPCCFEDREWRHFFENNYISLASELRKDPDLVYPEKDENERNYVSYLPQKATSRSTTPIESCRLNQKLVSEVDLLINEQSSPPVAADSGVDLSKNNQKPYDKTDQRAKQHKEQSLMKSLILSICDLLFCPEFTVLPHGVGYLSNAVDSPPEDLKSLSTYDYVWEPGVGFESSVNSTTYYDKSRSELLRALLVGLSVTLYEPPESAIKLRNCWIETFASQENRHALPLFTSLLNVVFGYKPSRKLLFLAENSRERLVYLSAQLLSAVLDYQTEDDDGSADGSARQQAVDGKNLFSNYMSRIHRSEDFEFMLKGFIRLMNDRLGQGSMWAPSKSLELDQELQLLLWRFCNLNRKFMKHILASNELQDLVVPILYHMNENFREPSKTALIHVGLFNLLILSSERNFGVKLNKPYTANAMSNLPEFSGTHADLMIIIFHKLVMYGYRINQLYDYLLTILVNVSPYLKSTTILASKCLIQLFETFSSPLVIFTEPSYHQLVIFLLEFFNNIIQYQFDGNSNLIYIILTKKEIFVNLANLPTSQAFIDKVLRKLIKQKKRAQQENESLKNQDDGGGESEQDEQQILIEESATVSSSNNATNSQDSSRKQEVSLVATPDLYRVTLSVFPFEEEGDKDSDKTSGNGIAKSDKKALFNLDDIMSNSNETERIAGNQGAPTDTSEVSHHVVTIEEDLNIMEREQAGDTRVDPTMTAEILNVGASIERGDAWRPTSEWLKEWKQTLPLQTIMRMISALDPQIEQMKQTRGRIVDESELIKFLQSGTLVGLLPVPHPIQIRKYRTNSSSVMWFRTCTWGIIYVRSTIWTGTDIQLIKTR